MNVCSLPLKFLSDLLVQEHKQQLFVTEEALLNYLCNRLNNIEKEN